MLFSLIEKGDIEIFFESLKPSDCNIVNEFNMSLLQSAISNSQINIAEFLIKNRCNINQQDDSGYTALHYLLTSKDEEEYFLIELLLEENVSLDKKDYKYNNEPLFDAIMNAKTPLFIIKRLLEKGANPHHKNVSGNSSYDMVLKFNIPELNELFKPYI